MHDDFREEYGFSLTRQFSAAPERVFAALADAEARKTWGTPAPSVALRYDSADFREGGRDVYWCVIDGDPRFKLDVIYHEIRAPNLLSYIETCAEGDARMFSLLVSYDIRADGKGSMLEVTLRGVSLDGTDALYGPRHGMPAALDNLVRYIDANI
jgi:uncharacterized protein YndB with AHSA1/START domain